ncbi:MAG: ribonuclease III [Oscillospiraceae bacterium]|jgi:ribonuclease-3|nr:ribonuclease III [Oscillospiraceae bacterium]
MDAQSLAPLEARLGYAFRDKGLLRHALTHSSFVNEHKRSREEHNERLEFLGDAVLGFCAAEFLFERTPALPEGEMTRARAELVCARSLVLAARDLDLGAFIQMGRGEEVTGGRARPSVLADTVEAVIAAVFLDGGFVEAKRIVTGLILSKRGISAPDARDHKTILQELIQRTPGLSVSYRIADESGPDHQKIFIAEAIVNGEVLGAGEGASKKSAEQAAACAALERAAEK